MKKSKNKLTIFWFIFLAQVILCSSAYGGHRSEQFRDEKVGTPHFSYDYTVFYQPSYERILLEMFVRIPFKELYSYREDQIDNSKFEMAIVIKDEKGKQVTGASWERGFENPNSEKYMRERAPYVLERKWFELAPEKYSV